MKNLNYDQLQHYQRLVRQGWKHEDALRIAGGPMGGTNIVLKGLDSGPDGFMRGRVENDGCCDAFTRKRVERNLGRKLNGAMYVPGLCPPGEQFSPQAVCTSRDEVIKKAQALGVGVRGPGINVEPRISDAEHASRDDNSDYRPSEKALKNTIINEVKQRGGTISRKGYRELVESLQDRHGQKKRPASSKIKSIFPEGM